MKFFLLLISFGCLIYFAGCMSFKDSSEWKAFKITHKKVYKSKSEEQKKFRTWLSNKMIVKDHNRNFEQGKVSYKMAVNRFSDMTSTELKKMYTGLKMEEPKGGYLRRVIYEPTGPISDTKDWRESGAVTDVKDQGQCGSCYSFSVSGAIEGQHFLATKKLVSLSEQQIVDCSKEYENDGCGGGYMHRCYDYIKDAGGLDTEEAYPYEGVDSGKCRFDSGSVGATVKSYDFIDDNEDSLQKAVDSIGPISIGIKVQDSFFGYGGGVYDDKSCTPDGINHAVLLVGYGNEGGKDFWLVKNSWVRKV